MAKIYLGIGSNVGDRQNFIKNALSALSEQVQIEDISSIYRTEPWGNQDQPEFLNVCAGGSTTLPPKELLAFIKSVESVLGRTHSEKWGPREIDIDILFYNDEVVKFPGLNIPHPYLAERAFVLIPLAEIAADFVHPVLQSSISELASKVDSQGIERVANE